MVPWREAFTGHVPGSLCPECFQPEVAFTVNSRPTDPVVAIKTTATLYQHPKNVIIMSPLMHLLLSALARLHGRRSSGSEIKVESLTGLGRPKAEPSSIKPQAHFPRSDAVRVMRDLTHKTSRRRSKESSAKSYPAEQPWLGFPQADRCFASYSHAAVPVIFTHEKSSKKGIDDHGWSTRIYRMRHHEIHPAQLSPSHCRGSLPAEPPPSAWFKRNRHIRVERSMQTVGASSPSGDHSWRPSVTGGRELEAFGCAEGGASFLPGTFFFSRR
ncbi:hypothetical protein BV898_19847 [Hypsibius exemplaris]|uniref:Uncharacterized protein n=1 Tax=Hypsibius exemplaris TaxID=2072580 RepID=A0A9X6RQ06_HYPEX|nr:hypothetical protein BV898_19847 [Hypsibius exemplaris]